MPLTTEAARCISVEVAQAKAYTAALLGRDGPEQAPMGLAAIIYHEAS